MKRHIHHLVEAKRHFTPPLENLKRVAADSDEMLKMAMFGVTTVELRCSECGDIKTLEIAGDAR